MIAVDPKGYQRWRADVSGFVRGGPTLTLGAQDDRIYALDAAGRLRGSFDTEGDVDAPLVVGPEGVLHAGSYDGHIYALR